MSLCSVVTVSDLARPDRRRGGCAEQGASVGHGGLRLAPGGSLFADSLGGELFARGRPRCRGGLPGESQVSGSCSINVALFMDVVHFTVPAAEKK